MNKLVKGLIVGAGVALTAVGINSFINKNKAKDDVVEAECDNEHDFADEDVVESDEE